MDGGSPADGTLIAHALHARPVRSCVCLYDPASVTRRHIIRVNTPGVTTADMTLLPFRHRRRPMFPFEAI